MAEQHRALRVDAQSLLEVDLSQVELLLFVVDHPQTVPVGGGEQGGGERQILNLIADAKNTVFECNCKPTEVG